MHGLTFKHSHPELLIELSGEIDVRNADEFYESLSDLYEQYPTNTKLDCENLSFIDSSTLGMLVKFLKKLAEHGHKLTLCHLTPNIKRLFTICRLDMIIKIED